jgi:TonB-dependent receptor
MGFGLSAAAPAAPEDAGTGSITGRVSNPENHEYVNLAKVTAIGTGESTYTDRDGSYRLDRVPAGQVSVAVDYTGFDVARATVTVVAGQNAVQDFSLRPAEVVRMEAVKVSSSIVGDAKAIVDQRNSLNLKSVMAWDSFGENPDGNMGEFLKLMPGVTIDYAFIQARGLRLEGLDPKYATVSLDGISMSSAGTAGFASSNRSFDLDAFSMAGVSSVELNKTLTASLDASSVTGNVNLVAKLAFDQTGRSIYYDVSATANTQAMTIARSPGWLQKEQYKIGPNVAFGYSDVFLKKRLGISISYSDSSRWSPRYYQQLGYNYSLLSTRGPVITNLRFGDEAVMVRGTTINFNTDFKATEHLILSLRFNYAQRELPGLRRIFSLTTTTTDSANSSLTYVNAAQDGNNTNIQFTNDTANEKWTVSTAFSPRFRYTQGDFTMSGGFDYSLGTAQYMDMKGGFFNVAQSELSRIGFIAVRTDPMATDWTVQQTAGRPWLDPSQWNLDAAIANNINTQERKGTTEKYAGYVNLVYPVQLKGLPPITLKAGGQIRAVNFKLRGLGTESWSYVGPGTSQTAATAQLPVEHIYSDNTSMNAGVPNWPRPDRQALYQIFQANPSYFVPNTVTNFTNLITYPKTVKEDIDAAYLEAGQDWGKLRLDLGVRYEKTTEHEWRQIRKSAAQIAAERPDLVSGTIPYVAYQYANGSQQVVRETYGNTFLSGGAKYSFLKNLDGQLSFSDGILRPDYQNLAGALSVNDTTKIATVPNPNLRPELSTKYYAGLNFYFQPAGSLSVGAYDLRLKNLQTTGVTVTQADAGYADLTQYNGYTFITTVNLPDTIATKGVEVDYRQQLVFLPWIFKGLSVYGSFSRVVADRLRVGVVPRSGSGGVTFKYRGLTLSVDGTWQTSYLVSQLTTTAPVIYQWEAERKSIDTEASYKFSSGLTCFINARNMIDSPFTYYDVVSTTGQHLLDNTARYGAFWTAGVRRRF